MKSRTACLMGILMLGIVQALPVFAASDGGTGGEPGEVVIESPMQHFVHVAAHTVLQLGVIIILAVIARRLCEAVKQPPVVGALLAGVVITNLSKFGNDSIPIWSHIFPIDPGSGLVVTEPLWILGGIGAIILLFLVGVEMDFEQVKRVGTKSTWITLGGIVLPFIAAPLAMLWFFTEGPIAKPEMATALFMGAVFITTSVGISVKVYSELRMLDTEEGLAVLVAGIVDDIGGLLVLSGVLAYATGGEMNELPVIAGKALVFLAVIVIGGKMIAFRISDFSMHLFGRAGAPVLLTGIALVIAAIAESQFQLAMIVGAAAAGMVLSGTRIGHQLEDFLKRPEELLSPVFFVVMGMLVDLRTVNRGVLVMSLVMTVIAIIGKVVGCGLPAKFSGFTNKESLRIGVAMNNRGEVGLIVAGLGYATGNFDPAELAVAIIVILLTTVPTPSLLKILSKRAAHAETARTITIREISEPLRNFIVVEFLKLAHRRGFSTLSSERDTIHEVVNEDTGQRISLSDTEDGLVINASGGESVAREILAAIKESVSERLSQAK